MLRNRTAEDRSDRPLRVRGGLSPIGAITGMVVAFGAVGLLSAIAGGIFAATNVEPNDLVEGGQLQSGVGVAIIVGIVFFLAYLWGGYTAGRMARGAGAANGFMVPLLAVIVALIVAGVVNALGSTPELNVPFISDQLRIDQDYVLDYGQIGGIIVLIAMFVGGILGGMAGSRWHTKLERKALAERDEEAAVVDADRERERRRDLDAEHERERRDPDADRDRTADMRTDTRGGAAGAPPAPTRDRDVNLPEDERASRTTKT